MNTHDHMLGATAPVAGSDTGRRGQGWDDATTALQYLYQLEGDALNVALLVPESKRATRAGLVHTFCSLRVSGKAGAGLSAPV